MTVIPSSLRPTRRRLALLAMILALAGRLASGMVVADAEAGRSMAALLDATVQCQSDMPGSSLPQPGQPPHHEADHGLWSLASLLDLPCPTPAPAPTVPLRRGVVAMRLAVATPVRGPPPHPPGAALPRGPPTLA